MQIRLILLDFDGTLADTRRANTLAYVATLREAGYALTEEEYAAKYFGMRCNEFLTRYGIADPAERERLRLDARADELGIESLDLAVALFEIEERFGVNITQALPGTPLPTVGDIVQQVMAQRAQRPAAPGGV